MQDCVFCKIVERQSPADILYEDDQVLAFRDARPAAPTHLLIVPKRHIPSVNELNQTDEALVGSLFSTARLLAEQEQVHQSGYRLIVNTGPDSGQAVFHIHMHLLGGQRMRSLG